MLPGGGIPCSQGGHSHSLPVPELGIRRNNLEALGASISLSFPPPSSLTEKLGCSYSNWLIKQAPVALTQLLVEKQRPDSSSAD